MDSEKNCITVTKCSNALSKHTMNVCEWADFESDFKRANELNRRERWRERAREKGNENDDTIMVWLFISVYVYVYVLVFKWREARNFTSFDLLKKPKWFRFIECLSYKLIIYLSFVFKYIDFESFYAKKILMIDYVIQNKNKRVSAYSIACINIYKCEYIALL